MIYAIDFDGTVVTHDFPEVGEPVPFALDVIKALQSNGHKIILWTMRSGKTLEDAEKYFKDNGVELWGANLNPDQHTWSKSPKQYANVYIDDAALGCPLIHGKHFRPYVDWIAVGKILGIVFDEPRKQESKE